MSSSSLIISVDVIVSNNAGIGYLDMKSMMTNKCSLEGEGPFRSIAKVSLVKSEILTSLMVDILHMLCWSPGIHDNV